MFDNGSGLATIVTTAVFGVAFGIIWALVGYAATRGQRDFSSVRVVVATRYEVLVEHKLLQRAQELLAQLPGASPQPVRLTADTSALRPALIPTEGGLREDLGGAQEVLADRLGRPAAADRGGEGEGAVADQPAVCGEAACPAGSSRSAG